MSKDKPQPAINTKNQDPQVKSYYANLTADEKAAQSGVFCRKRAEPQPVYIKRDCETIYSNQHGAYVCLGKDNLGPRNTGYAGAGETACASIDLVVGRASYKAADNIFVDPLPYLDAARVYLSQKTDADDNFGLAAGSIGNRRARSAIVAKADGVRIVGIEGVKIVTGVGQPNEKNSMGGSYDRRGIDLIAMNDDGIDSFGQPKLQSLVKGQNLVEALKKLTSNVDGGFELIGKFLSAQIEFNAQVAAHFHISPFFGAPTSPSPSLMGAGVSVMKKECGEVIPDLIKNKVNIVGFKNNYLEKQGAFYILSAFNNTN